MVAVCELHCEVSHRVVRLRRVRLEETALVCHIVRCDRNVVVLEDLEQLRVVANNTAGHNLAAGPLRCRELLKLCVQLLDERDILALRGKPSGLQDIHSLDRRNHVAVLVCELHEATRRTAIAIVKLDARLECLRGNCLRSNLLKLTLDLVILIHRELQAPLLKTVLRVCEEDGRHLVTHCDTDVLRHRAQRITYGRRDHAVQLIEGAVQQHLKSELCNRAIESCAVLLRHTDGLVVCTPDTHRHHACRIDKLFRHVVRKHANDLLALCLILLQLRLRMSGNRRKLL